MKPLNTPDIVERLRSQSGWVVRIPEMSETSELLWDAIDEIERLRLRLTQGKHGKRPLRKNG